MRSLLLAALAAVSLPVVAQDLPVLDDRIAVSISDVQITAIYPDSIRERYGVPTAWALSDYVKSTAKGARSGKVLYGVHCEAEELGVFSVTEFRGYNGTGDVVVQESGRTADFTPVSPGSAGERILKFICGMSEDNAADRAAAMADAYSEEEVARAVREMYGRKAAPKKPKGK